MEDNHDETGEDEEPQENPVVRTEGGLIPPEKSMGDHLHTTGRIAASVVPLGPATELFSLIFKKPLESRVGVWRECVARAILRLQEQKGISIEELQSNEVFLDILMQATQAAVKTHNETKRAALRNAILNSALPGAPEETLQQMYIQSLDALDEWHLRILGFFADPQGWSALNTPKIDVTVSAYPLEFLEKVFPELEGRTFFVRRLYGDLVRYGYVIEIEQPMSIGSDPKMTQVPQWQMSFKRTTDELGDGFVKFITEPRPDNE